MARTLGHSKRIGIVSAMVAIVMSDSADAKVHRRHGHVNRPSVVTSAEPAAQNVVHLGAMRYYGGPKSPMWREVR
jgi:hypothetical protein